jgi:hypothetical protein
MPAGVLLTSTSSSSTLAKRNFWIDSFSPYSNHSLFSSRFIHEHVSAFEVMSLDFNSSTSWVAFYWKRERERKFRFGWPPGFSKNRLWGCLDLLWLDEVWKLLLHGGDEKGKVEEGQVPDAN